MKDEREKCYICGSPDIYKYAGGGPLCRKCAGVSKYDDVMERKRQRNDRFTPKRRTPRRRNQVKRQHKH